MSKEPLFQQALQRTYQLRDSLRAELQGASETKQILIKGLIADTDLMIQDIFAFRHLLDKTSHGKNQDPGT